MEAGAPLEARDRQRLENATYREVLGPEEKRLTAAQIRELDADLLCMQEVENLPILKAFRSEYLTDAAYTHALAIDGNDPASASQGAIPTVPRTGIQADSSGKRASDHFPIVIDLTVP